MSAVAWRAWPAGLFFLLLATVGCEAELSVAPRPVALTGPDRVVVVGTPLVLDATGSFVPGAAAAEPENFEWSMAVSPADSKGAAGATIGSAGAARTELGVEEPGLYVIRLVVAHGGRKSEPAYMNVTAHRDPLPPVAVAGPDQRIAPGAEVVLDGSGSYSRGGGELLFSWRQTEGPAVDLRGPNQAKPSFEAPLSPVSMVFELTVTDEHGQSGKDEVAVTVEELGPVVLVDAPASAAELEEVVLDATGSHDPHGESLSFSWSVTSGHPDVLLSDPHAPLTGFSAPRVQETQDVAIDLLVESADGRRGSASVEIAIEKTIVRLAFGAQPPAGVEAGAPFAVEVEVVDEAGERAAGADDVISIALVDGGGAILAGELERAAQDGRAFFSGLYVDGVTSGPRLIATSPLLEDAVSEPFDVVPGVASRVVVTGAPSSVTAGRPFEVTAEVHDANGYLHEGYSGALSMAVGEGPSDSVGGTLEVAAREGVAVFPDVSLARSGTYFLRVSSGGLTPGETGAVEVVADLPAALIFATAPLSVTAGSCSPEVLLRSVDAHGNSSPVPSPLIIDLDSDSDTLTFHPDAGCDEDAPISSVELPAGESAVGLRFRDVTAGSPTLIAVPRGFPEAELTVGVEPGSATKLAVTSSPSGGVTAGAPFSVVAEARDELGNRDPHFGGAVSLTIFDGPADELAGGQAVVDAVQGVATFSNLSLGPSGSYVLRLDSTGLTEADTGPFTVEPAEPSRLTIVSAAHTVEAGACSPPVVVWTEDDFGNPSPVSAATLVEIEAQSATMITSLQPDCATASPDGPTIGAGESQGAFHFRDTATGSSTLTVSATGLSSASQDQYIVPGAPVGLFLASDPRYAAAGTCAGPFSLESRDAHGNLSAVADDLLVNMAADSPSLEFFPYADCIVGTAIGSLIIPAGESTGSVFFRETVAGEPIIFATPEGYDQIEQQQHVHAGPPYRLAFTAQPPPSLQADAGFEVEVEVQDAFGNRQESFSGEVSLSIAPSSDPGTGELQGTTTRQAIDGTAGFSDLYIDDAGQGYRLLAAAGSLLTSESRAFDVFIVPTHIFITLGPPASQPLARPFMVTAEARDDQGRVDQSYEGLVSVQLVSGPQEATLGGVLQVSAAGGSVSFEGLWIDWPGEDYVLRLQPDDASISVADSGAFDVPPFAGGSGSSADPYQVENVHQLQAVLTDLTAHYLLISDIDASDTETWQWNGHNGFVPLGTTNMPFTGELEGDGHVITDLYIDAPSLAHVGLFGVIDGTDDNDRGRVRHLCVLDADIVGHMEVGAIAGEVRANARVVRCCSTGQVTAVQRRVGGVVGRNHGLVRDSFSRANVMTTRTDGSGAGGLVGRNWDGRIRRSYSTGTATSASYAGGLVGYEDGGGDTSDSFWDMDTSGHTQSWSGTGKTTAEMKDVRTFTDPSWSSGLSSSWDFTVHWDIDEDGVVMDGYPFLRAIWD